MIVNYRLVGGIFIFLISFSLLWITELGSGKPEARRVLAFAVLTFLTGRGTAVEAGPEEEDKENQYVVCNILLLFFCIITQLFFVWSLW